MASSAAPSLAPVDPPLGPQPPTAELYSPNQITMCMKEKVFSLSGDDFTVQTIDGTNILKVKGKTVSLHGKKKFTNMRGDELFTLNNKMLALQKSFVGESPAGHNFEVTGKFSIGSSKSVIEFTNYSDKKPVELKLKGDWIDHSASITLGDRPIAHIGRNFFNARELFGGQQTYFVSVAPNVDLSLIAAICVCLDERENEK